MKRVYCVYLYGDTRWQYVKENDNVLIAVPPLKSSHSDFTNDRQSSSHSVIQSVKLSCVRSFDGS